MILRAIAIGAILGPIMWFTYWRWIGRPTAAAKATRVLGWYRARFATSADEFLWANRIDDARSALDRMPQRSPWEVFDRERIAGMLAVSSGAPEAHIDLLKTLATALAGVDQTRANVALAVQEAATAQVHGVPVTDVLATAAQFLEGEAANSTNQIGARRLVKGATFRALAVGLTAGAFAFLMLVAGFGPGF